jgi:hypothetical protein
MSDKYDAHAYRRIITITVATIKNISMSLLPFGSGD